MDGTTSVLELARNATNLQELMENGIFEYKYSHYNYVAETLIGALARVLKEDSKKSYELATNIVHIFYCFSIYTQFQSMISHFKVSNILTK